jgi:orotidine 5'-phosphate decarboxylase subfamily 2
MIKLNEIVSVKKSILCVGLDPTTKHFDVSKMISETKNYAVAYKLNFAFYFSLYQNPWQKIQETIDVIKDQTSAICIADGKFGDIDNTAKHYAKAIFELGFDAVTVNPYMGSDAILPFAEYQDKLVFVLSKTSNKSAKVIQDDIYETVMYKTLELNLPNIGFVIGGTLEPETLKKIRKNIAPNSWFLMPGFGAQGGNLNASLNACVYPETPNVLISVSRSIINSESPEGACIALCDQINPYL